MRKNKMMRTASGLLVATLLTTSVISGTFAKYTTKATGSDSARVAKFGVEIDAKGGMFAEEYDTDDADVARAGVITKSVITSGESGGVKDVVAPGTKGVLANATISGTPEVAVHVGYEPTLTLDGWKLADGSEYCPIVFTVGNETYGLTGMKDADGYEVTNKSNTITDLKAAVETAIKEYSANYAPKTDLNTIGTNGYVHVSWNWAFDNSADENDTYLGNQAAKNNASTVELSVKTTVTQID